MTEFNYDEAFSRNIGWLTESEQQSLRKKRIAIAGMGGVGGVHLLTLSRLGVGQFNIADFDQFELANFNRQAGASMPHLEQDKAATMNKLAQAINPELTVNIFDHGVNEDNLDEFLAGVDLYVDGLDFFVLDIRQKIFARCYELGIPAITAAPLGMGVALLNFLPGKMSFEQYFRLKGYDAMEQQIRFLVGLSPAMLQRNYLMDKSRVDFLAQKGPSTAMACELCAGAAATEALKILLNRGKLLTAPWGIHFDAYQNKLKKTWRPWGNNNPIQRIAYLIAKKNHSGLNMIKNILDNQHLPVSDDWLEATREPESNIVHPLLEQFPALKSILDYGRWAPSGDNMQPWRFKLLDEFHFDIHGFDTREHCVYDLQGHASQLAMGMLIENLSIGAAVAGLALDYSLDRNSSPEKPIIHITLKQLEHVLDGQEQKLTLAKQIVLRTVHRRPLSRKKISQSHKKLLEKAVSPLTIKWFEGRDLLKTTHLFYKAAGIRLKIPEAFATHSSIMEWKNNYSRDKMPVNTLGLSPVTRVLMHFALKSWERVKFLNTYLAGTLLPRIELDIIPGLFSGAHFVILDEKINDSVEDFLEKGHLIQRFWLTATSLGIQLQPQMTPLIFSKYEQVSINFTVVEKQRIATKQLKEIYSTLLANENTENSVFIGRLGYGSRADSRSTRLSFKNLILD